MKLDIKEMLQDSNTIDLNQYYGQTVSITNLKYFLTKRGEKVTFRCNDFVVTTNRIKLQNCLNLIQLLGCIKIEGTLPNTKKKLRVYEDSDRFESLFHRFVFEQVDKQLDISLLAQENVKLVSNFKPLIKKIRKVGTKSELYKKCFVCLVKLGVIKQLSDFKYEYKGFRFNYSISLTRVNEIYENNGKLIVAIGKTDTKFSNNTILVNNVAIKPNKFSHQNVVSFGTLPLYKKQRLEYQIPIENLNTIEFESGFTNFSTTSSRLKYVGNLLVTDSFEVKIKENKLIFKSVDNRTFKKIERLLIKEYIKSKKRIYLKPILTEIKEYKENNTKNVIIISDRINKADDNGEFLLKYAVERDKNHEYYYAISKESDDYHRLSEEYNVIDPSSFEYLKLLTRAVCIISSQSTSWVRQSNISSFDPSFINLYTDFKYIFLQHGLLLNDLSFGFSKMRTGIDMFFVTTQFEKDEVTSDRYMYESNQVPLAGMPRLDNLFAYPTEKIILYMPTWRGKLVLNENASEAVQKQVKLKFEQSDYCVGINDLIGNEKLNDALTKNGYKMLFVPHPNLKNHLDAFNPGSATELLHGTEISYSELISKCEMLITDYSSVMFDAMYAKKHVISYFPDFSTIADSHYIMPSEVAFNDHKPLVIKEEKSEKVIELIISSINEKFQFDPLLEENRSQFYTNRDQSNRERVWNEIEKQIKE